MALLEDAAATARSIAYLAIVPVVSTLLAFEKLARTATAGPGGGVKFPMPTALPDLWTFVSVPSTGVSFNLGVPLVFTPVFFALAAVLIAGYVGSIDAALDDEHPDFVGSATDYAVPVLVVQLVVIAVTIAGFGFALVGGMALAPLSILFMVAAGYLLWAAPILVVTRDIGALEALQSSIDHALQGGRYATFSLAYLLGGILGSFVLSMLVRGRPLVLLLLTIVLAYPLLVLSVATVQVVKSLPYPATDSQHERSTRGRIGPGDDRHVDDRPNDRSNDRPNGENSGDGRLDSGP